MIALPFKISVGVMLLLKNKTRALILQRGEPPRGEGPRVLVVCRGQQPPSQFSPHIRGQSGLPRST